jgi:hypothetical protein
MTETKKPAVFLATPAYDGRREPQYMAMRAFSAALEKAGYQVCEFGVPACSFVGWARDLAAHVFKKCDGQHKGYPLCDPMVFIDNDISFAPDVGLRLLQASEKHPLVGAACPKKEFNFKNVAAGIRGNLNVPPELLAADFVFHANTEANEPLKLDEEGLLDVKSAGTGLLVIRRKVFDAIEKAGTDRFSPDGYFYRSGNNAQTLGEQIFAFFHFRIRWDEADGCHHYDSEDYSFCNRWRALSPENRVKILADAETGHTGMYTFKGNLQKTLAVGGKLSMPKPRSAT